MAKSFDVILGKCPFLAKIITDKIAEEVAKKDAEITELKAKNTELENAILDLASVVGGAE